MQRRWANVKTNAVAVAGPNPQIMCHFMQMESKEALTKKWSSSRFFVSSTSQMFLVSAHRVYNDAPRWRTRPTRRPSTRVTSVNTVILPTPASLNFTWFNRLSCFLLSCFDSTKLYPKFDGNYEESILGTRSKLAREKWSKTGSKKEYFLKK